VNSQRSEKVGVAAAFCLSDVCLCFLYRCTLGHHPYPLDKDRGDVPLCVASQPTLLIQLSLPRSRVIIHLGRPDRFLSVKLESHHHAVHSQRRFASCLPRHTLEAWRHQTEQGGE